MKIVKKIKTPIIACLLLLMLAIPIAMAMSQAGNQQQPILLAISLQIDTLEPPEEKQYTSVTWTDPTISGLNVSQDLNITLNGNLNVTETGELHLIHCVLNVNNGTTPIEYGVTVYGGMYINGSSTITALNSSNPYYFTVYEGAVFQMNDSRVEYCGHSSGSWPDQQGLVVRADDAWIENNTITNGREGLLLWGSEGSTVLNNSAINNNEGFRLENCTYNNLTGNYGSNNWRNYLLEFSSYSTLTGNTGANGTEGIKLHNSSHNTLTDNTATNNSQTGFWLYLNSNNNTLTGNNATNTDFFGTSYGFRLSESSYNTLSNNTAVTGWYYGFYLEQISNNNNLTGNTAYNIISYSFFLESSNNNNLTGNNANNNSRGFCLYGSLNNNLTGNTATNSNGYGFYLGSSSGNNILGNTALNSTIGGYYLGGINNNFTGSVEANYLRVKVTDGLGSPIPGTDVDVETDGTHVYRTPYFGGINFTTDSNGVTPWIAVTYGTFTTNDTMTMNTTTVTVWNPTANFSNNPRTVNMSMTHVETFQLPSPLPAVFYLSMLSGMQGGTGPLIYAVVIISAVAVVVAGVLVYYFRFRKV